MEQSSLALTKKANDLYNKGAKLFEHSHCVDSLSNTIEVLQEAYDLGHKEAGAALGVAIYSKGLLSKDSEQIITELKKSCEYGYTQAMYTLAKIYLNGTHGVLINTKLAAELIQEAANKDHTLSQIIMANMLLSSPSASEDDIEKGLELFTLAADKNNRAALLALGIYAANGVYGEVDYDEAHLRLERGCLLGSSDAMYQLAHLYADQKNPAHNQEQYLHWLAKAASNYHEQASKEIKRYDRLHDLISAAEEGDKDAQFDLGMSYRHGILGADRCHKKAQQWLELAAEQLQPNASYELAKLHSDNKEGRLMMSAYYAAAKTGHAAAMFELGEILISNEDEDTGMGFLVGAADAGLLDAQLEVAEIYHRIMFIEKANKDKALHYYGLAAAQGCEIAKEILSKGFM